MMTEKKSKTENINERFSLLLLEAGEVYFEEHDVLCLIHPDQLGRSPASSLSSDATLLSQFKEFPEVKHFNAHVEDSGKFSVSTFSNIPTVTISPSFDSVKLPNVSELKSSIIHDLSNAPEKNVNLSAEQCNTWKKNYLGKCIKGKLKICSKSIVFETASVCVPVLRVPLRFCDALYCSPQEEKNLNGNNAKLDVFCHQTIEMLQDNVLGPYNICRTTPGSVQHYTFEVLFPMKGASSGRSTLLPVPFLISQLHRAASLPPNEQNTMVSAIARSIHWRATFDLTLLKHPGEEVLLSECGHRITPLLQEPGRIVLTKAELCYQPHSHRKDVLLIPVTSIRSLVRRRFLLQPVAVEVFCTNDSVVPHLLLAFKEEAARNALYSLIEQLTVAEEQEDQSSEGLARSHTEDQPSTRTMPEPSKCSVSLERLTYSWVVGAISNYDYLMAVNSHGGRSINDLTQYPVFPWVIRDYSSPCLDLEDPSTYRDLTRPIGALNLFRLKKLKVRLNELGEKGQFLYGSHYSTPGFVLFYLVRALPQLALCLHNGRFDHPDRMFNSLCDTYHNVTHNPSDFKELTPEFYDTSAGADCGRFLRCSSGVSLGTRCDGRHVGDVELPPWASCAEDAVRVMRAALESDHVSGWLHCWIDLIFGYKQRGEEALAADNLFHPMCYEGSVDLPSVRDPSEREALEVQIAEFGQVPQQVFVRPHPRRARHLGLYDALYLTGTAFDGFGVRKAPQDVDEERINQTRCDLGSCDQTVASDEKPASFVDKYSLTVICQDDSKDIGGTDTTRNVLSGESFCNLCGYEKPRTSINCHDYKFCSNADCDNVLLGKLILTCLRSYLCDTCLCSSRHSRIKRRAGYVCFASSWNDPCSNKLQQHCYFKNCSAGTCPCRCGIHVPFRECVTIPIVSIAEHVSHLAVSRTAGNVATRGNIEQNGNSTQLMRYTSAKYEKLSGGFEVFKAYDDIDKCDRDASGKVELPGSPTHSDGSTSHSGGSAKESPQHAAKESSPGSFKLQELITKIKNTSTLKKNKKETSASVIASAAEDGYYTEQPSADGHPLLLPLVTGLLVGAGAQNRNKRINFPIRQKDLEECLQNTLEQEADYSFNRTCRCFKDQLRGCFKLTSSRCHTRTVSSVLLVPSQQLAAVSEGPMVKLLHLRHPEQVLSRRVGDFSNSSCLYFPWMSTLLVSSHDGCLYSWRLPEPSDRQRPVKDISAVQAHCSTVTSLAWSKGLLFTGAADGCVRVWRVPHRPVYAGGQTGQGYWRSCHQRETDDFTKTSFLCVCGGGDESVSSTNTRHNKCDVCRCCCCQMLKDSELCNCNCEHESSENIESDERGVTDAILISLDHLVTEFKTDSPVTCLAVNCVIREQNEESWLVVGHKNGNVVFWDVSDLSVPKHVIKCHNSEVTILSWWTGDSEDPCANLNNHEDDYSAYSIHDFDCSSGNFGADNTCYDENPSEDWVFVNENIPKVASASQNKLGGENSNCFLRPVAATKAQYLLTGGADGWVTVLDCLEGVLVQDWHVREPVMCAAWDGRVAVVGGQSGDLIVRDVAAGVTLTRLSAHPGGLSSLVVSECGRVLVTGGTDHTVVVWGNKKL